VLCILSAGDLSARGIAVGTVSGTDSQQRRTGARYSLDHQRTPAV